MTDALAEQITAKVESLRKAIKFAYTGSAEHGSFLRQGPEYVPSVFMTLDELDALLAVVRERSPQFYDEHGGQNNLQLGAKVRATMEHIARCVHAPVNVCPSYFAFGPIYDLVAAEVTEACGTSNGKEVVNAQAS